MNNTKLMVLGGVFTGISVVLQLIPVAFSEILVLITILSSIPVYLLSRVKAGAGMAVYISASLIITMLNSHEGLFFIFGNGPVGLCLGACRGYGLSNTPSVLITSAILTVMLSILSFGAGIPIMGDAISKAVTPLSLTVFSVVYCCGYNLVFNFIYRKYEKISRL